MPSYDFKYVENIAAESKSYDEQADEGNFINAEYRATFKSYINNPNPENNVNSLLDFSDQNTFRDIYLNAVQTPGFLSAGILDFYDYGFFENCALPIDVFRREALIGEPICWGSDFAAWYATSHRLDSLLDKQMSPHYIDVILRDLRSHTVRGEAIVMSAPGQEIYGHWLLDVVPRLYILSLSEHGSLPIYLNNMPEWGKYFLQALDIDPARIKTHPASFFKIEKAIIPTASKSGFRLAGQSLRGAWSKILGAYQEPTISPDLLGDKVFFSRRKWAHTNRRTYANQDEVEVTLRHRGYKIIVPESLSIPQQIRIMKQARVLVGEDGSALHNIIFCEPGARLGVLTLPERKNLWHLGICQLLDHKIAYCPLPEDIDYPLDLALFNQFLDVVETG